MTRPPGGAGFAQFFPAAPRLQKDRVTEREKAKRLAHDAASSLNAQQPGNAPATDPLNGPGRPSQDLPFSDGSQSNVEGLFDAASCGLSRVLGELESVP